MSSLHPFAAAATLAQSSGVDAHTVTAGRLMGTTAALVAMAGVIIGGLALARSGGHDRNVNWRRGAVVALGAGLTGVAIGGFVVAVAEGGPPTGAGIVGGFVAIAAGLIAVILGGLALTRSPRPA